MLRAWKPMRTSCFAPRAALRELERYRGPRAGDAAGRRAWPYGVLHHKHYDLLRRKYGLPTAFMKRAAACGDDDPTGANPPMLVIDDANAR